MTSLLPWCESFPQDSTGLESSPNTSQLVNPQYLRYGRVNTKFIALIFLSFCCSINPNQRRLIPLLQSQIGIQWRPSGKKSNSVWPLQWSIVEPSYSMCRNLGVEARGWYSDYCLSFSRYSLFLSPTGLYIVHG